MRSAHGRVSERRRPSPAGHIRQVYIDGAFMPVAESTETGATDGAFNVGGKYNLEMESTSEPVETRFSEPDEGFNPVWCYTDWGVV